MKRIEVRHVGTEQVGLFKKYGRVTRLRNFMPKHLVDDLKTIFKKES